MSFKCRFFAGLSVSFLSVCLHADEVNIRNPSAPLFSPVPEVKGKKSPIKARKQAFTLSSIIIGFGKKIATINNKEYREGDYLGRYLLKEINADHVVMTMSGKKKVLALYAIDKAGFVLK